MIRPLTISCLLLAAAVTPAMTAEKTAVPAAVLTHAAAQAADAAPAKPAGPDFVLLPEDTEPPPAPPAPSEEAEPLSMPKEADFERLPNGDIRLGKVLLQRKERCLSFPVKPALTPATAKKSERGGIIDVLVASKNGRLYEAAFCADARPYHVQVLLILLGLNNGTRLAKDGRQGDLVDVDVTWQTADGKTVTQPIENFLLDSRTKATMKRCGWVFTGTLVQNGIPCADAEGNIILSWSCGSTILDTADPAGEESNLFSINLKHPTWPPDGALARLVITPRLPPAAPAAGANGTSFTAKIQKHSEGK